MEVLCQDILHGDWHTQDHQRWLLRCALADMLALKIGVESASAAMTYLNVYEEVEGYQMHTYGSCKSAVDVRLSDNRVVNKLLLGRHAFLYAVWKGLQRLLDTSVGLHPSTTF